jgi:hypothetical protein
MIGGKTMGEGIIGLRCGMLVVQSETEPVTKGSGQIDRRFICLCDCGKEIVKDYRSILNGKATSCGCTRVPKGAPLDLTGCKFDRLTVLSEAAGHILKNGVRIREWNCICECGHHVTFSQPYLTGPKPIKSCGCAAKHHMPHGKFVPRNLVGNRYGMLTVVSAADSTILKNGHKTITWLCKCDCGKEVNVFQYNLVSGHTRSCGCLRGSRFKGTKFGMLTVVSQVKTNTSMRYWNCTCECGNSIVVSLDDLLWGSVTDCGCLSQGRKKIDLKGQTFGRLMVIREAQPILPTNGNKLRAWLCECTCGRQIVVRQGNLTGKITRSCGCLKAKKRIHVPGPGQQKTEQ